MKLLKTCFLFIFFNLFLVPALYAAEVPGVSLANTPNILKDIELFIQFYNKKIYYVGQNDVYIKILIINKSMNTFKFNLAKNKFFNIDFEAFTPGNIQLKHSDKFIIEKNSNQPAFFKETSIEPGEEFGFIVELNDFVKIDKAGIIIVQAIFYPELNAGNNPLSGKSNKLSVDMKPAVSTPEIQALIETETGKAIEKKAIPPDEVVTYMINARQKGQWEKFFLYLDIKRLYTNSQEHKSIYLKSTELEQIMLIDEYKKWMQQEKVEKEISLIPNSFSIEKTTYNQTLATVITIERFKYRDYTEVKKYTYTLEKSDRYWMIISYAIENLGTE